MFDYRIGQQYSLVAVDFCCRRIRRTSLQRLAVGVILLISANPAPANARIQSTDDPPAVAPDEADPFAATPPRVRDNLGTILTLDVADERLTTEICPAFQTAQTAFMAMGQGSSSGSSSGGAYWRYETDSKSHSIGGQFGDPYDQESARVLRFEYTERSPDGWRVFAQAGENADVLIRIFKKGTPYLFLLEQQTDGRIRVVVCDGAGVMAATEPNFVALLDQHPALGYEVVLPTLRNWGLSSISGKYSANTIQILHRRFAAVDDKAQAEFDQRLVQLNATQFDEREQASKWLTENASDLQSLILRQLDQEQTSPEVRDRLRKALLADYSDDEKDAFELFVTGQLANDPELLVWTMRECQEAATVENIRAQLQKISGQSFQTIDLWTQWLVDNGHRVSPTANTNQPAAEPSSLPEATTELGTFATRMEHLIPLCLANAELCIDEEGWQQQFGGKTVEQLAIDLEKYLRDNGLPNSWLSIEGCEELKQLHFAQIVFQRMQDEMKDDPQDPARALREKQIRLSQFRGAIPKNSEFDGLRLSGRLELVEGVVSNRYRHSQPNEPASDVFIAELADPARPGYSIQVGQWKDDAIRIVAMSPDSLIYIYQSPEDVCQLSIAVGNSVLHRAYANAASLFADEYVQQNVTPYLQKFGVSVATD